MKQKAKIGLIIIALIISIISTKAYGTTGKASQETVRIRKEASTDSGIVTLISLNEEVEILSEDGDWYKIKYKTYTGYVRKDMLEVNGKVQETTFQNTVSSNENTSSSENLTAENTSSSENLTTENNITTENITETNNQIESETETTSNSNEANTENTTTSEEIKDKIEIGFEGILASKIELKLVPSITSSNINEIEANSQIIVKDIINKWSYVETDSKSGWVLTSKIKVAEQKNEEVKQEENKEQTSEESKKEEEKQTESKETTKTEEKKTTEVTKYVSAETLNMRETAENDGKIISQLKVNTKVTVVEQEGTWAKVKVNGKTGYVASKYLSDKKVDVTSRSEESSRGSESSKTESSSSATNNKNTENTSNETSSSSSSSSSSSYSSTGASIVACAKKYMGYKYVSGGSSPSTGFDCSGFTSYVYKQCGISISRSSSAQATNGTAVSKSNLQLGDLVIFNNRANTSIGHVGIYIGGNTFIHAGNSGTGVITTSLSDSYYQARYVTARRIIN